MTLSLRKRSGVRHPQRDGAWTIPGTGWLRSFGRLSYEIYLTHMFVVFPVVRIFKASGANLRWGILWFGPALALSWMLGWAVARYLSVPGERALRHLLMRDRAAKGRDAKGTSRSIISARRTVVEPDRGASPT